MEPILFQPFQPGQVEEMTEIIDQVWDMQQLCGTAELGRHMAADYLRGCIEESSWGLAALLDGAVAGLIFARREGEPLLQAPPEWTARLERFSCTEADRPRVEQYTDNLSRYQAACRSLTEDRAEPFDGEITLFAVRPELQGRGIGAGLFREAQKYLSAQGCRRYFLYTDSNCSYGFYDANGMERAREKEMHSPLRGESIRLFLYQGRLPEGVCSSGRKDET